MKKKKQRYCLVFHSRADEAVSAQEKHAHFFKGINELTVPWGLGDRIAPSAPEFGHLCSATIDLTRFFGDGVKRAMMTYVYRRMLEDRDSSDDALLIDFDPAKVDTHYLIYTVIPCYVEAFDAYRVAYYDEQFVDLAWETPPERRVHTNPRFNVNRVDAVSFYDELLCRRAFNLSPAEVLERLQGKVEHGQLLHGGVYLVGSSQVLSFDVAQLVCRDMTSALRK